MSDSLLCRCGYPKSMHGRSDVLAAVCSRFNPWNEPDDLLPHPVIPDPTPSALQQAVAAERARVVEEATDICRQWSDEWKRQAVLAPIAWKAAKEIERALRSHFAGDRATTGAPTPEDARIYPCDRCGVMRSKAEGGTTFTVCDTCWDILRAPSVAPAPTLEPGVMTPEYFGCPTHGTTLPIIIGNPTVRIGCCPLARFYPAMLKVASPSVAPAPEKQ